MLERRLRDAVARLNPSIPAESQEEAVQKVLSPSSPSLVQNNRTFHLMLVDGIEVEYRGADGTMRGDRVRLADVENPENNDWLAVNQFAVKGESARRPDIVLFVNGLPLGVIELKNPTDENATVWSAFRQLQTYKREIPRLFTYNQALVVSDGVEARVGSLTADRERFMPWRTIEGETEADSTDPELEVAIKGLFDKERFLNYLSHFIVFEETGGDAIAKKIAGYHQFHAVNAAVDATVKASRPDGDKRCGVHLAYARLGQEPDDGILRRGHCPAPGNAKPDTGRHHRPQRFGRSTVRHIRSVQPTPATNTRAGARQGTPARTSESRLGRRSLYHGAEVFSRR